MKTSSMSKLLFACVALAMAVQFTSCCGTAGGGTVGALTPVITSLTSACVPAGSTAQSLTITGTNFVSGSTVTFNGVAHTVTFVSSTQLEITLTAADLSTEGTFPVIVTNPGGSSSSSANFTVGNPVPTISSLAPTSVAQGTASQVLTINGTNFVSGATSTFNGVAHTVTFVSATELTITLSATDLGTAGTFAVQVANPIPCGTTTGSASNTVDFSVISAANPVPTITSLSPPSVTAGAAAQTLTITGTNYIPTSSVTYNGVVHSVTGRSRSHALTYVSSTELTITLSAADQATPGSYPVQVTNPAPGGGASNIVDFEVMSSAVGTACITSNALVTLINGSNVTAYVPNGAWDSSTLTGIEVVPLEPTTGLAAPSLISTPNVTNACAGNSATQEVVCTANNTDVYAITGAPTTCPTAGSCTVLTSGSTGTTGFSGGSCFNCGIAINALTNTAVINMGISTSPSGSGFQFLDLNTNKFGALIPTTNEVSENIQWDPNRNVPGTTGGNGIILSPNEGGNYDVLQVTSSFGLTEYANPTSFPANTWDSAAEDCTTGIALATDEGSSLEETALYISDLTQGTFTAGTPGSWTAPDALTGFLEFANFTAQSDGIAVVPGFHLAIVTGEFGGNNFGAVVLPSSSGTGTPAFGDYVAAIMPNTPDGNTFTQGDDPHTIYAYVSPNNGKPYGLMTSGEGIPPTWVGIIDLQALLAATRCTTGESGCLGPHQVDPSVNLLTTGIVRYVCANTATCAAETGGAKVSMPRR